MLSILVLAAVLADLHGEKEFTVRVAQARKIHDLRVPLKPGGKLLPTNSSGLWPLCQQWEVPDQCGEMADYVNTIVSHQFRAWRKGLLSDTDAEDLVLAQLAQQAGPMSDPEKLRAKFNAGLDLLDAHPPLRPAAERLDPRPNLTFPQVTLATLRLCGQPSPVTDTRETPVTIRRNH
jgi:hypothetical protein